MMCKNSVYSLCLLYVFFASGYHGALIEFYKSRNYSDVLFQSITTSILCNNIPGGQQFVGSIKTDTCLVVYKDVNCKSESSWRKNPDDRMIWPGFVGSFRICNDDVGGNKLNIDFTTYSQNILADDVTVLESYRRVCSCQPVPPSVQNLDRWSIDNFASDLLVFYEPGCSERKWKGEKIRAGFSQVSKNVHAFTKTDSNTNITYKIQSFSPVPSLSRKCGIMEMEMLEISNNTRPQSSSVLKYKETNKQTLPRIQFYEHPNSLEFLFDRQLTLECSNLPNPNDTNFITDEIMSIETGSCIMVYSNYDCEGRSIKIEAGQGNNLAKEWESTITGPQTLASIYKMNLDWKWPTRSFNACNIAQSGLNVDVTEYQGDDMEPKFHVINRYRDICTCENIPKHVQVKENWSINNFGNSMVAYFEPKCTSDVSSPLWIPAGRSSFSIGFGLFKQADQSTGIARKIRSFGPDPNAAYFKANCVKIFSTIIKFEIDEPSYINYEERYVTMLASKTVFHNNGPSQLTQTYSASKTVRESVEIDIGKSFSKMDSVHVDDSVDIETRTHKGSSESKSTGTNTGWSNSQSNSVSTNKGYENRQSTSQSTHQSSDSRNTGSVSTSLQTTVGAEAGGSFLGFSAKASVSTSVGVNAGFEHSSSKTQGSTSGSESVNSVSGSSTNSQDVSSGSSGGTSSGQEKAANYFQEDGFKQSLRKAYDKSGTLSSSTSNSTTIENTKSFSVTQTIHVAPCTEQVVQASVKVITNKGVKYEALAKIRGQLGNRQMTSAEVRYFMDGGLEYIKDFDEYTVLAYSTGIFTAEYGVSSIIKSEGSIIKTCQEQLNGCPVCQTCTNEPLLSTGSDSDDTD